MGRRTLQIPLLFVFALLIISSTATPSRIRRLMEGVREIPFEIEAVQEIRAEIEESKKGVGGKGRELDLDDYPGSGANNRHSPP